MLLDSAVGADGEKDPGTWQCKMGERGHNSVRLGRGDVWGGVLD